MFGKNNFGFLYLTAFVVALTFSNVSAQATKQDENALRRKLQARLDEWRKNGKFAGDLCG